MSYKKSEETRSKLITTTSDLLQAKGYAAMGLNDIIKNSGIPKGSLYHHFPKGKEELASETIRFSGLQMLASLTRLEEKTGGPAQAVAAFCSYFIDLLENSGYRRGCPLATVALETAAGATLVQQACSDAFQGLRDNLKNSLIKTGVAAAEAENAALMTIATLEGALLLAKAHNDTAALAKVRDNLVVQLQTLINKERK